MTSNFTLSTKYSHCWLRKTNMMEAKMLMLKLQNGMFHVHNSFFANLFFSDHLR